MKARKTSASVSRRMRNCACPEIKPAFAERNISVAISTDENYLPYVKVLVNSIAANTKSGNLDILILTDGLTLKQEKEFLKDFKGRDGVSIRFLNVGKFVKQTVLSKFEQKRYLSAAACYRLFLPDVLTAYDKIIYLDVDTSVCRDLGDLYAVDLKNNFFGAAVDIVNSSHNPDYAEWAREYGFVEWDKYVNTGVMLLNLASFRKEKLLNKLLPIAVEASKWFCDQDALNFVCKGKIASLDSRWNVQVGDYCLKQQLAITKGNAYIYHFTGDKKPWNYPEHKYAYLWWKHSGVNGGSIWRKCLGQEHSGQIDATTQISVIVPVFNAEKYLWECLVSVLRQRGIPGLEVICVDDGSTDGSHEILEACKRLDSRVKVICQRNQGPGAARNAGMKKAKGKYITFLDADDRFASSEVLAKTYRSALSQKLDVLMAPGNTMSPDGRVLARNFWLWRDYLPKAPVFKAEDVGRYAFLTTTLSPWGKLFRRAFIEKKALCFPLLKKSEDFPFVILAFLFASRMGTFAEPMVCYRRFNADSLEGSKDSDPLAFVAAEDWLYGRLNEFNVSDEMLEGVHLASLRNFNYNLRASTTSRAFRKVAEEVAKRYPLVRPKDESSLARIERNIAEFVGKVVESCEDEDALEVLFAEAMCSRYEGELRMFGSPSASCPKQNDDANALKEKCSRLQDELDAKDGIVSQFRRTGEWQKERIAMQLEAIGAKDSALEKLRGVVSQLKGNAGKQREALAAKDAALAKLREVVSQLKGNAEKQRKALGTKDAALAKLRGVVSQLKGNVEKQRKAVVSKDVALEQLRGVVSQLKGNVEKQREALAAKDTALEKLREVVSPLKGNVEKQREALAAKDAALEQLRGVVSQLKGNAEKQRKALAAKDTALEKLREVVSPLKGNAEKQREALAAKDAALEQLRGVVSQLKGNAEKQRKALAAKDTALEKLREVVSPLKGNVEKQREALAAKDAALEQLRGVVSQLKGNAEKQRKALAAKDTALEKLREVVSPLKGNVEKQREALAAKDAALEQLRGVVSQLKGNAEKQRKALGTKDAALEKLRGNAEKQRKALAAKDTALEKLREVVSQLKGNAEKQREALAAKDAALGQLRDNVEKQRKALVSKDAALEQLRGVVSQLKDNAEKQRKALVSKDAALEQLRGAVSQLKDNGEKQREALAAKDTALELLRGNAEKQRKALATKDAALEQLRGVVSQLKDNAEKQRKALVSKDAALEQLRGAVSQLKDNGEKQREALAAKDTALEKLRGAVSQLKDNVEKQRETMAAKDAALKQLRGVVAQLKRDAEKRREVIVAKNRSIAAQSAAITSLRRGIDGKQRLLDKYERTIGKLKGAIDL